MKRKSPRNPYGDVYRPKLHCINKLPICGEGAGSETEPPMSQKRVDAGKAVKTLNSSAFFPPTAKLPLCKVSAARRWAFSHAAHDSLKEYSSAARANLSLLTLDNHRQRFQLISLHLEKSGKTC